MSKANLSRDEIIRNTIFRDLTILNDAVNFRQWTYDLIEPFVGRRILEIGSGTGNYTTLFKNYDLLIPSDYEKRSLDYLSQIFADNVKVKPRMIDANSLLAVKDELKEQNLDTLVMLNVLEHVQHQEKCLIAAREIISDQGNIILVVPAHKFLFSKIDLLYGHHRRYSSESIKSLANKAGLNVKHVKYFNAFATLGWMVNMKILGKTKLPEAQTKLFDKIVPILRRIEDIISLPFGLSLLVVLNKKTLSNEIL